MIGSIKLFEILGIDSNNISNISQSIGISKERLLYYHNGNKVPIGKDLSLICEFFKIDQNYLKLKMGHIDREILDLLSEKASEISKIIPNPKVSNPRKIQKADFTTEYGQLFKSDCISFLNNIEDHSFDLIFADPPFNLNKIYPSKMNDLLKEEEYLHWQEKWVSECIRTLKPGGSFFLWNLPKWNSHLASLLNNHLTFRHWISVDIKYSLPIQGRLYPSHYSLLYYIKGERPNTFHPDRVPMDICPKCLTDLKDYGGYKNKMNPAGVNISDVWYDIPPVRHKKYKRRNGANELSIKLLDRIIEMASDENDLIFDPFGGSGTTYIVSEIKKRRWIGTEIGPLDDIINRFDLIDEERDFIVNIRSKLNCLFTDKDLIARRENGLWTPESVRKIRKKEHTLFDILNIQ